MFKKCVIIWLSLCCVLFARAQSLKCEEVLQEAMRAAENYNKLVEHYEAKVYTRSFVETIKKNKLYKYSQHIPKFVLHDPNNDTAILETYSTLRYTYPNNYVNDIQYVTGSLTSQKDIEAIPYNIINFNIYGETTNDESFFMPIRFSTRKYYSYKLVQAFEYANKTYYEIKFEPVYENPKLLVGSFVVEEGNWRVISYHIEVGDLFTRVSAEVTMGTEWLANYLPQKFTIFQTTSYLGNAIASRYLMDIDYKKIVLREDRTPQKSYNISDFYRVRLDSVPIFNDTIFWDKLRPIPLQAIEKETLDEYRWRSEERLRAELVKGTVKKKKGAQMLAKGLVMDTRYKHQSTQIGYSGLLNPLMIRYSSVDGVTYRQRISFNHGFGYGRSIQMNAYGAYIFGRKEFLTDINTTVNYNPWRMGSANLSFGIGNPSFSSLFKNTIQEKLQQQGLKFDDISPEFYKDYFVRASNSNELTNGFLFSSGFEYHYRKGKIQKLPKQPQVLPLINIEYYFRDQVTFAPFFQIVWTPGQYYRYEGRQKRYVRSAYPTFKFEISQALEDVFEGTSAYTRVELDINQNLNVGLMRTLKYHVGAGTFINAKTEYFADFRYFAQNNFIEAWDERLGGSFNLLDWRLYSASDAYIQAHLMYESPFLFLKSIPIVSDFAQKERLYFSQLYTPDIKSYTEIGYGIGNKYFDATAFVSFHKTHFKEIGARFLFTL